MSMESAKAFVEKMKTDEDFRKKVTECKDPEARKGLVMNEGFNFTVEDLKKVGTALTDSELDVIGAGGCYADCHSGGRNFIIT